MNRDLIRLMTWLSPAFPVGAFSYSHGIERAVHDGLVRDARSLEMWLSDLLRHGSAWNDAVLLAEAWRKISEHGSSQEVAWLGEAMAGSAERQREMMLQGEAFLKAAAAWPGLSGDAHETEAPYPVAVGTVGARNGVPLEQLLSAFLHAFVANLVQAAIRLVPLGQSEGLAVVAALEPLVLDTAGRAARSLLDDLGSAAFVSEIETMKHETQYSRLFRS